MVHLGFVREQQNILKPGLNQGEPNMILSCGPRTRQRHHQQSHTDLTYSLSRTMRASLLGSRFLLTHRCLVLLLPLLAWQTRAFLLAPLLSGTTAPSAPQVGSGGSACRPQARSAGHRATIEDSGDTVPIRAEVWEGFEEEDHDRFLAEFWQKKPLLIRRAVKG